MILHHVWVIQVKTSNQLVGLELLDVFYKAVILPSHSV